MFEQDLGQEIFHFQTMSLATGIVEHLRLGWISDSEITHITSTSMDNVYNASRKRTLADGKLYETMITLILLGNNDECTRSEFARIYSLPTRKYNNNFRRYEKWFQERNNLIKGFTKYDDNYYMVADKRFYHSKK